MKQMIDIAAQRGKLKALESAAGPMAELWRCVRRLAREQPAGNPWLLPFVALIDEAPTDIANAKAAIDRYLAKAEQAGSTGYLFNIWCFAFPHCRWAIWFQMMRDAGFYTEAEAADIAAKFLLIQFRDHHAGMLIKPFPECVDNQAASLVLSSYVVGSVFAELPGAGHLARKLRDEASPRLEAMIGGMPNSGYSGEGSTYQGLIVAFAVPFLTEALEDLRGEDLFDRPLWPNGTSPRRILQMTKRCWLPGGLLLPWDDYGYQIGVTTPLAYLAHRTGDADCLRLLAHDGSFSRLIIDSAGWGYDHAVWTLVYWPQTTDTEVPAWSPWAEDELGAVLVDAAGDNYLMQMWDPADHMCSRAQVNPNSLVLARKGIPFSADGTPTEACTALNYEGAVFERSFGAGAFQRMNLSKGCAGSHNSILVDGNKGMRPPPAGYERSRLADFDAAAQSVTGDVTGLYASCYDDCRRVLRRSRLIEGRFWLVEDFAEFAAPHDFTSRWWFRPDTETVAGGVDVHAAEGALLQLRCLVGSDAATVTRVDGFPREPDGCSDRVDFGQHGRAARWLYALWPTDTVEVVRELTIGWRAFATTSVPSFENIGSYCGPTHDLHPGTPPWFQRDIAIYAASPELDPAPRRSGGGTDPTDRYATAFALPHSREQRLSTWVYTTELAVGDLATVLLRSPRGIADSTLLWLNGRACKLPQPTAGRLMPHLIDCADFLDGAGTLTVTLVLTFASEQEQRDAEVSFPDRPWALCTRIAAPECLSSCSYADESVVLETSAGRRFEIPHTLMT